MKPLLCCVVGARPNFVKAAPVLQAIAETGRFETLIVHTGQHYDEALSELFFRDLAIDPAGVRLEVGSGSHAVQTAEVMLRLEPVLIERYPACLLVFGDINSTVAAAVTAVKLGIPVAHVEAGLRSFDRTMPEEINRILTDAVSDLLFTTEASGSANLEREGVDPAKIHFVGNTMIDTLDTQLESARERHTALARKLDLTGKEYGVVTLHRPSNVDDDESLLGLLQALGELSDRLSLVFPVHPRTRARLADLVDPAASRFSLVEPLGYLDFLSLLDGARLVLTDSGGIQEETTALGVPCLTLRDNTERPVTVDLGTNRLAGTDPETILRFAGEALAAEKPARKERPPLWDGRAAQRLAAVLVERFG